MNIVWIISACVLSFIILAILLSTVFLCKRSNRRKRKHYRGGSKRRIVNSSNYAHRDDQFDQINEDDLIDENCSLAFQKQTSINHQQQHLLVNNMSHMCSTSSATSTLLKHQRTPHHQPLIINNPNHMMMNLMNPLCVNSNNSPNINEMEFYSNMANQHNQPHQLFTSSSHQTDTNMCAFNSNESCMNGNQNYFNDQLNQSCDNDNTSAAIAAANAAFNAPINGIPQATLNQANTNTDMMFVRHTIKPKPIAIPLGNQTDSINNTMSSVQSSVFGNSSQRKSFRNLPMATATLISSNGMQMNSNQLNSNFGCEPVLNKHHQAQKIHYTARPYIIDNQVQPSKLSKTIQFDSILLIIKFFV